MAGAFEGHFWGTQPQLAMNHLGPADRGRASGQMVAFGEAYGRSEEPRTTAEKAGLAYVAIIPCDYQVTSPSGTAIRADRAVKDAVFERRSCGTGPKVPRYSYWAMTAAGHSGAVPADRRLISVNTV